MEKNFANVYQDSQRADSYAKLEFPGTYWLAFRDLPGIFEQYVNGSKALDFGCGAGRSTRFLRQHGFAPLVGIDIADEMLQLAQKQDADGDYRLVEDGDLSALDDSDFDLILAAFTFDNIPSRKKKVTLFRQLLNRLADGGCIVCLVSSPEIYWHEWASFTTKDFPENRNASSGNKVKIIMLDVEDRRPVEDILCDADDAQPWVSETEVAPWTIYVLSAV